MTCTRPLYIKAQNLFVPCCKCTSCRIQRTKEWTIRILHETDAWSSSVFITLTYNDENLPSDNSIKKKELQNYIKRLRKELESASRKIKYYACGEYGDKTGRPHYHAIIFGISTRDADLIRDNWPYGFVQIGTVTRDSARYVAGYVQKKYSGPMAKDIYGERQPPFQLQSQGIGKHWMWKNEQRLREDGYVTVKGVKNGIPRYYKRVLEIDPGEAEADAALKRHEELEYYRDRSKSIISAGALDRASRRQKEEELRTKDDLYGRGKL